MLLLLPALSPSGLTSTADASTAVRVEAAVKDAAEECEDPPTGMDRGAATDTAVACTDVVLIINATSSITVIRGIFLTTTC